MKIVLFFGGNKVRKFIFWSGSTFIVLFFAILTAFGLDKEEGYKINRLYLSVAGIFSNNSFV